MLQILTAAIMANVKTLTMLQRPYMMAKNKILTLVINPGLLTSRQVDCASQLIQGKTAKEIAAHLGLSKRTIEFYIENIKTRLNCSSRSELISKLLQYVEIH